MVDASNTSGAFERGHSEDDETCPLRWPPRMVSHWGHRKWLDRTLPVKSFRLMVHWHALREALEKYELDQRQHCTRCHRRGHVSQECLLTWPNWPPKLVSQGDGEESDHTLPVKGFQLKEVHWQAVKKYKLDHMQHCTRCRRRGNVKEDCLINWLKWPTKLVSEHGNGKELDRILRVKRCQLKVLWQAVKKYI